MLYIQPCANGNLLFLQRKNQSGQVMHNIRYTYPNGNNRLGSITSTGIASSAYQYDALGNLVRDNAEGLTMGWNAMGKVDTIHRNGSLLSSFRYSPTGQRQVKTDSSGTTFYIHDATGNVMCVYKLQGDTLTATERYLYGNKRLGMLEQQVWRTANNAGLQDSNTIGVRVYEFADHLGNVTYTAQDRKWLVLDSYGQLQFIPATVNYTDYYPFGYPMWERSYYNGGYRYFFNGQEADNEVLGEGTFQNYGFRMYDTRIARFWGVDPLTKEYPMLTPFQFASCSPVWGVDLDGLEVVIYVERPEYLKVNVGHVFLSVGSGDDIIAYSYGRYGELGKNKGPFNPTNISGEGVLYKYVGKDAANLIRDYLQLDQVYAFEIKDADEQLIRRWFDYRYKKGKYSSSEKLKGKSNAKVIDIYNLFFNNCTTITIDALLFSGTNEPFATTETVSVSTTALGVYSSYTSENVVNTPEEMFKYLDRKSRVGNNIKNVKNKLKNELQNEQKNESKQESH